LNFEPQSAPIGEPLSTPRKDWMEEYGL